MNEELAKYFSAHCIRTSSELAEILPMAKEHLSKEEYEALASGVGVVLSTISIELTNKILVNYPQISQRIDYEIEKYGIVL
jgi:hypothetical protein